MCIRKRLNVTFEVECELLDDMSPEEIAETLSVETFEPERIIIGFNEPFQSELIGE